MSNIQLSNGETPLLAGTTSPNSLSGIPTQSLDVVRCLQPSDLVAVSDLFGRVFRPGRTVDSKAVSKALASLYLDRPIHRFYRGSLVHVGKNGRVDGFLGIIDIDMQIRGRPIRCGVLGSFMSEKSVRPTATGAKLLRYVSRLPYDVVFSDTASTVSLAMARALHFEHLALESLQWSVVLRPTMAAASAMVERFGSRVRLAMPVARATDAVLTKVMPRLMPRKFVDCPVDRAMSQADFKRLAPTYAASYALRPTWAEEDLDWLLTQAGGCARRLSFQIREVVDRAGRHVGAYLTYETAYKTVVVLQVFAQPRREALVYRSLVARAAASGATIVRGPASPGAIAGLAGCPGLIFRAGKSAIVRTRDPEVSAALKTGDHLLGGLVGETWASLACDLF